MRIERTGLPSDVSELFWSDRYWYAASQETGLGRGGNMPVAVGVGSTKEDAIADMRKLLREADKEKA